VPPNRAPANELVVGVPAGRFDADPRTGAGRVWTSTLARLERLVRVEVMPERRRRPGAPRPDVWLASGHEGALRVREPVVAVVHGAAWMTEPDVWAHVPRAYAERLVAATEAALACAHSVIVPSEYTRRALTEGYGLPAAQVAAVPHGVDDEQFAPSARGGRRLVAEALGADRPYVLFASIPSIPQKNLPALRAAMERLVADGLPHALVIAGGTAGGESEQQLRAIGAGLAAAPGRVAWLGHVGDGELAGLMAEAAAFCLPSLFESFGLTALEALACGAPVVVSDRGALPEVVGDAAVVSEPDPEALAAALATVLTDPGVARALSAAGRARALELSWERTAGGWLAALRRAAWAGAGERFAVRCV
jgi:glycosyltransferase involved in cell wall biosynthesis